MTSPSTPERLGALRERIEQVTRVEVIDHRPDAPEPGRVFVAYNCRAELSVQDNRRTLKLFIDAARSTPEPTAPEVRP